ncbi:MAG: uncharacterized protein KVP18_005170 [Porospora cf. gigantea A]|uniref:uncharacterized protein n=1 Tax=Porospora cf. gigantea A TaxID=2853593 RepID=UPI003559379D|nr:MAG: hypothetical protein KVP18_005170 [Porospora cf. gigantea A]
MVLRSHLVGCFLVEKAVLLYLLLTSVIWEDLPQAAPLVAAVYPYSDTPRLPLAHVDPVPLEPRWRQVAVVGGFCAAVVAWELAVTTSFVSKRGVLTVWNVYAALVSWISRVAGCLDILFLALTFRLWRQGEGGALVVALTSVTLWMVSGGLWHEIRTLLSLYSADDGYRLDRFETYGLAPALGCLRCRRRQRGTRISGFSGEFSLFVWWSSVVRSISGLCRRAQWLVEFLRRRPPALEAPLEAPLEIELSPPSPQPKPEEPTIFAREMMRVEMIAGGAAVGNRSILKLTLAAFVCRWYVFTNSSRIHLLVVDYHEALDFVSSLLILG